MSSNPYTPQPTADGSYTFFSDTFGEQFHSVYGARQEAQGIYVQGCKLAKKAQQQNIIRLLDICYGLGYNSAAALAEIWRVNPHCRVELVGLELELEVIQSAITHGLLHQWESPIPELLQQLTQAQVINTPQLQGKLLIGDARQTIQTLTQQGFQADAVFLDPFSPPKCPQLWTVDFLRLVAQCLANTGLLATYSSAAAVRRGLQLAGLNITSVYGTERKAPGTLASHTAQLPPLSQKEEEHLQTKAAVPYRDCTFQGTAEEIKQQRQAEKATSNLASSNQWKKKWYGQ
jgi:tRNA U34 5-methylaminomethyl-2-thiouridine-forming methyltransferase MnmC